MAEAALRRPPQVTAADWLRTLPPAARWVLHGDTQTRALAAPVWGVGFSDTACRALRAGERATLWLGPEEYLLLDLAAQDEAAPDEADRALATAASIEAALRGTPHALVDVSHRQFALEVSGAHAEVILRGTCPLDLDISRFPVGMCTRTVFAKADIVLWRTRSDAFHLEVWRSFAGYVGGLLHEIAREFSPS
jgi:sarcosine oxidase, subunit gamma